LSSLKYWDGTQWVSVSVDSSNYTTTVQSNLTAHTSLTNAVHGSTSSATPNRIVQRDGSGNFSAGTITATFSGGLIETISSLTGPGTNTTLTLDVSTGTTFTVAFNGANISGLLFTNVPIGSTTITLVFTQDGTGNKSVTWGGTQVNGSAVTPKWAVGAPATFSTAANAIDIITFVINRTASTTAVYGFSAGKAFA